MGDIRRIHDESAREQSNLYDKKVTLMFAVGFTFWLAIVAIVARLRTGRKPSPTIFEPLRG